jgi:hypothetical protein
MGPTADVEAGARARWRARGAAHAGAVASRALGEVDVLAVVVGLDDSPCKNGRERFPHPGSGRPCRDSALVSGPSALVPLVGTCDRSRSGGTRSRARRDSDVDAVDRLVPRPSHNRRLHRVDRRLGATVSARASWALLATALLIFSGCRHRSSYEPPTTMRDAQIENAILTLQNALNARSPASVCALYVYPAPNCAGVWERRLARLALPLELRIAEIVRGCAGDARVAIAARGGSTGINSVTVVSDLPGQILDVGVGRQRSSLVIPRYGDCADPDGSAGDERCDVADQAGAEDSFRRCRPR